MKWMEAVRKGAWMEKYIFYEELGSGGSGKVYRVYDTHLKCDRAVKKFYGEEKVWEKERNMMKELRHPLLPMIVDSIEAGDERYLVMEYIEGKNLEEYIEEKGCVAEKQAVKWALELADFLIYLHERQNPIIYRDMKPANIIIDGGGKIHLVDLGTAWRPYQEGEEADGAGTYGYAAPEQISGGLGGADERSDIYGLGATLYHMLTGDNPSKPPYLIQPIRFFDGRLSVGLEKIVNKAVEEGKEKRYQTMRQFSFALERYKKADETHRYVENAVKFLYYGSVFCLCAIFAGLSGKQGREKDILLAAAAIIALCVIKSIVCIWNGRGRRGIRQERNILLTEKKGGGLMLSLLIVGVLFAASASVHAAAKEEKLLLVEVRNEQGQKLLIRYDAVYQLTGIFKLELPLSNFEEGQIYRLRLECINCETEEISSRTFYLKGLNPDGEIGYDKEKGSGRGGWKQSVGK